MNNQNPETDGAENAPSPISERELEGEVKIPRCRTPSTLWEKFKPYSRNMRKDPTEAEHILWQALRGRQIKNYRFRRQHSLNQYIVDFYCAKAQLVIEVDGPVHRFTDAQDALRQAFLEAQGFRIQRFSNEQIITDVNSVIRKISDNLL